MTLRQGKARLPLKPRYERLLLKERVDGNFGLSVGMTKLQGNPKATELFQELLVTAVEAVGGVLSSRMDLPVSALKQVIESPFDTLADQLEDDALQLVATAGFDFHSESAWEGEHTFELKLNRTLRIAPEVKSGPPKERQVRNRKVQTFRKGTSVASVTLALTP